jgi:predicted  nucleic acid-binding Zn-ribbon protein
MVEIKLPEQTRAILDGTVFDLEDNIDDTLLAKFLFYVPTVVREYGLAIAELRRQKRTIEKDILLLESKVERQEAEVLLELDSTEYKNESLRSAAVEVNPEVKELKDEIIKRKRDILDIESDVDELTEGYWSFKALKDSLESITKLRVSERTF